jgi:hypothetical protein
LPQNTAPGRSRHTSTLALRIGLAEPSASVKRSTPRMVSAWAAAAVAASASAARVVRRRVRDIGRSWDEGHARPHGALGRPRDRDPLCTGPSRHLRFLPTLIAVATLIAGAAR